MKAVAIITSLVVILLCFSACDPGSYHFTHEYLAEVTSIELINYDNPDQKSFLTWVPDQIDKLQPYDSTKESNIETLEESKIDDFIDSMCESEILATYFAYDSPNTKCIRLNLIGGDFIIVWSDYQHGLYAGYIGKFASDGSVAEFIGSFEDLAYYKNLVNNYFQTKI